MAQEIGYGTASIATAGRLGDCYGSAVFGFSAYMIALHHDKLWFRLGSTKVNADKG